MSVTNGASNGTSNGAGSTPSNQQPVTGASTTDHEAPLEEWSMSQTFRDYRKVAIMALLAGLIAFMGSMIVPPTYVSGTRVLIRGRESTLLQSSGASLADQPGVIDSQLSVALSETEAALLTTRAVAEEIVDRLELDAPVEDNGGVVPFLKRNLASIYLRSRAILTHGFYKETPRRERMIGQVQAGLGAEQVNDSYVLEIAGAWETPEISAEIANTAADILVEQSNARFQAESGAYRDFLGEQVDAARQMERGLEAAVADYRTVNNIVSLDDELRNSVRSAQTLDDEIDSTKADVEAANAQVASLEDRLAETTARVSTVESIETGRSTTERETNQINPTYTALDTDLQQQRALRDSLVARLGALEASRDALSLAGTSELTTEESELRDLILQRDIATAQFAQLSTDYQDSIVNAQRPQVEISRLDVAAAPTFPVGPKRYLYLAIGMFLGGLTGFVWSFLAVKKREREALRDSYHADTGDDQTIDLDAEPAVMVPVSTSQPAPAEEPAE